MGYALWSSGPIAQGASTSWMMLTLPVVVYGIFRYQFLSDPEEITRRTRGTDRGGKSERPEEILLSDCPILFAVSGWILAVTVILFLHDKGLLA